MLALFLAILAASGAAIAFRGRWARGLLVVAVVSATEAALFATQARWPWVVFSLAGVALCLVGIAAAKSGR